MSNEATMERWNPKTELTKREQLLMGRLTRTKKLFAFLRLYRHEIFDDTFQQELESMYRDTGAGVEPKPPALMAMAMLLQAYSAASDAETVELTVVDLRWQLVLDCMGREAPLFSQGAFHGFRERMIRNDMDLRLLERTAQWARSSKAFDPKKLPKTLRVAIDSAPLEGAGRVEDTLNLLAHAARKVVECAATLLDDSVESICEQAGIPLLLGSSVKRELDVEWSDPKQKDAAMKRLFAQIASLQEWIEETLPDARREPPLQRRVETLEQLATQDLEPDPNGGSRIRQGVAPDRRVSVEDGEMRHGRKSKSKRFNGFKRHLAADVDTDLIIAAAVSPANRPEEESVDALIADVARLGYTITELLIDRGYINSAYVDELVSRGGVVICKPWVARSKGNNTFTKSAFKIDARRMTITCPAGETEPFEPGQVVHFDPEACGSCRLRGQCTMAASGAGRTVTMAEDELLQVRLRKAIATPEGRKKLRERVMIEHKLAHVVRRQGRRARYRGVRKNTLDLRRAAAVQNLETAQRLMYEREIAMAA